LKFTLDKIIWYNLNKERKIFSLIHSFFNLLNLDFKKEILFIIMLYFYYEK
jgi:hypothetical protein